MKALKIFLGAIYAVLLVLLLLNAKGCGCIRRTPTQHMPDTLICEVRDTVFDTVVVEQPPRDSIPSDTTPQAIRQAERIGHNGKLKVTLLWDFPGDIDLHVWQPNGTQIYYDRKRDSSTGGWLDIDNVNGGRHSAENICWSNPPHGTYTVSLEYYQPSRANGVTGHGTCTVVVMQEGQDPKTYYVRMSAVSQRKTVARINVN